MRTGVLGVPAVEKAVQVVKKLWYAGRDEQIDLGGHSLRYTPGTRPTRLKYRDDPDMIVRNDVRQLEFFCENIERGQTVIDVGANCGQYAVLFGALVGSGGRVIAFEPEQEGRSLMERNLFINKLSSRVTVEPFAVFDDNGEREFFVRAGDNMSSLERAGFGTNADASDIVSSTVQTVTLDEYFTANALPNPDWIKIDAEGAEVNVLRGAARALHGETKIVCELHPYAWHSFGTSFPELLGMVQRAGRDIRFLDTDRHISDGPEYGAVVIT